MSMPTVTRWLSICCQRAGNQCSDKIVLIHIGATEIGCRTPGGILPVGPEFAPTTCAAAWRCNFWLTRSLELLVSPEMRQFSSCHSVLPNPECCERRH